MVRIELIFSKSCYNIDIGSKTACNKPWYPTAARMHITMLNLVGEWLTTMTPLAIVEN
jgi:hypothetical protein